MKQICNLLFICCIMCSCKQQIEDNPDIIKINVNINTSKKQPIEAFFSGIEVMPLETTENSLLQNPGKIIFKDNTYYIYDKGQHVLFVFDNQGQFIQSSMHKKGAGPGEYNYIVDFDINPQTGYIEIVDEFAFVYKIKRYDSNFNFINETSLPRALNPVFSFQIITPDILVFYSISSNEEECLNFYSVSKNEVIGQTRLRSVAPRIGITQMYSFHMRGSDLFFTNRYPNNDIFQILYDEMRIKKIVEFDFGKHTFRIDNIPEQSLETRNFVENNNSRFVFPQTKHENDFCYFSLVYFKNDLHLVSYNKESKQIRVVPWKFSDGGMILPPAMIDNTYFYIFAQPDWIEQMVKQSLLDSQSQEVIANLREDDNPVILKYKIVY